MLHFFIHWKWCVNSFLLIMDLTLTNIVFATYTYRVHYSSWYVICNILYMLPVWINDLWDILIIIIISWESTFKGVGTSGRAATSAPILQQKLLQEKQKIHKSKYLLTKEAKCYRFLWSVDFTTFYTLRSI